MAKFWDSVTISTDGKTLSWDMTGDASALFDPTGCSQIRAPVDLTMDLPLPLRHMKGATIDGRLLISTQRPTSLDAGTTFSQLLPLIVTNDVPPPKSLDLVFVIDTTGSMWDDIGAVKSSSIELVNTIFTDAPDARVAIIDYKDYAQFSGSTGDYPYRLRLDFSNDRDQVVDAIQSLVVNGGGDWPESVYSGLMAAIDRPPDDVGHSLSAWRSSAKKTILLLGDAPPHDPEPVSGYTLQRVQDAAATVGGAPDLPGASTYASAGSPGGGVAIYTLQIGYDPTTQSFFQALAGGTGGQSFTAANAGDVVPAIRKVIGVLGDDPVPANRAPETRWASPSVTQLVPPNRQMVDIDILGVVDPDGDQVTIEVTKITQDEPPATPHAPDAAGIGTSHATLRAERAGNSGGRVYRIEFLARDALGAISPGAVTVCVPHDQGENVICQDDGQVYDATNP